MLAAPVAVRGAWPLHRAAVKNPLHGTATMDPLVSMGVSAAFLWSLYVLSSSPGPSARWVRHCGCCSISARTPGWWAFGCNVVALPVVSAGLLDPMITGVTMALSSFLVVTNSLRLRRFTAADH